MKYRALILMTVVSLLISAPLLAVNWWGLKDTAISRFNEKDLSLFNDATAKALDDCADGTDVTWTNPDTGASGVLTPLKSDRVDDRECRLLHIVNHAGGLTGDSRHWFCKMPDGSWKIDASLDTQGR